jgi:hydrophobe/amphiphile efflux-3 (HAE3) family protein
MARSGSGWYTAAPVERIARLVTEHPRRVVVAVLLLSAALGAELRHLRFEVRLSNEVPHDHPYTAIDRRLDEALGLAQTSLLGIAVAEGDVFTPDTLARLRRITDAVEALPGVVPDSVLSLTAPRAKAVVSDGDLLEVSPLVPDPIPQDAEALAALRERALAHPMYVGTILAADARGAMVLADFDDTVASERITAALEAIAARERAPGVEIWVGGQSPALAALNGATWGIVPLVLLALVVIAAVHFEAFRTWQAVILPLVTAALSVVWAMGLTAALGFELTPWTAITAVLVLSVAAGHAVQILKRYYECYHELGDNRAAVRASLVRIGPVTAVACGIAAAGFASLATFRVPAVRDFGLMAAFGILSTLVLELTFIPACRTLLRAPASAEALRERSHRRLDRVLDLLVGAVLARPAALLALVVAATLACGLGIPRLEVNTAFRSWFAPDEPVIAADRAIRERLTGTSTIRVLIESDDPDALLEPEVLAGIAELEAIAAADPAVTATVSLVDYLRVLHRAMDGGRLALPDDRALVEQYLLLFEPADLRRVLSDDRQVAAIHVLSRADRVAWTEDLFARLRGAADGRFPPGVRVRVGGGELGQAAALNASVVRHKLENMAQVALVIFTLATLVFRSPRVGLLVLAPLAAAVVVNLGVMGWIGSWLSFATASYTAMGVSLGADFAIYLLFRLREEARARPLREAVAEALRSSGRAVFFVASAIAVGNATLLASDFALWRQLGGYVALMMATSCLTTLTIVPALVLLWPPRRLLGEPAASAAAAR